MTGDDAVAQLIAKGIGYLWGSKPNSSADRDLRFVHAAHMLKEYDPAEGANVRAFSILKKMNKKGFTKWSIVYDIKNLSPRIAKSNNALVGDGSSTGGSKRERRSIGP